jgi:hypothetical protein
MCISGLIVASFEGIKHLYLAGKGVSMRTIIATFLALWAGPVAAFCGTYVGSPGVELTNQTSQVIIAREGTRTTLTLANDYVGDATNFAMIIPVPEVLDEDDIATVRPELFQRFNNYSAPRVVTYECEDWVDDDFEDGDADSDSDSDVDEDSGSPPSVVVEAEYSVGIYEIVILSSTESSALVGWLSDNGYAVEYNAEAMLGEYIEAGSYFFAAKVDLDMVTDGGFLEPLQFGYESSVFSLPVRLGTVNSPGEQDVVMYILTDTDDGKVAISNYPQITVEDECMADIYAEGGVDTFYGNRFADAWAETDGAAWMTEYAWATSWCDPCAAEPPNDEELNEAGFDGESHETFFTRIRMRYTPEAATQDVTLYTSGLTETEQIRYILYDEQMEDRFPVCGLGMVDDPGSCDDESSDDDDDDVGSDSDSESGPDSESDGGVDGYTREVGESKSTSGCSTVRSGPTSAMLMFIAGVLGLRRRR